MTENEGAQPAVAKATHDEAAYKNALVERFREAPPAAVSKDTGVLSEKAVDYIYRAIDRQINKARGALAYNGLLFASFSLIARNSKDTVILTLACLGAILALGSCFPLIFHLMIFDVGDSTNYASSQSDFTATFASMWKRKLSLKVSLWVSGIATVFAILLPIYTSAHN
jgi:hypothetical protein